MAIPQKTEIRYEVEDTGSGGETMSTSSVLRFHATMTESHSVNTEITKFPVQSGFNISNHAIRKNRRIVLKCIVSDYILKGTDDLYGTNSSNSRTVYAALKELIRQAKPCEVLTNLDTYDPVIFTGIKTEQGVGKLDIMEFTLTGEEVQVASTVVNDEPPILTFTPVPSEKRQAVVDELKADNIDVPEDAVLEQAKGDMHQGFRIPGTNSAGESTICTYKKTGYDPATGEIKYSVQSDDTNYFDDIFDNNATKINWGRLLKEERQMVDIPTAFLLPTDEIPEIPTDPSKFSTATSTFSACLADQAKGMAMAMADDYINTAMGKVNKAIYGFAYNTVGAGGLGATPLGAAITECVVASAWSTTGEVNEKDFNDNSWPTGNDLINGAKNEGNRLTKGVTRLTAPVTFTKII